MNDIEPFEVLFQKMSKILEYIAGETNNENIQGVNGEVFDAFVKAFLCICEKQPVKPEYERVQNMLADAIVEFIDANNSGNIKDLQTRLAKMKEFFLAWQKYVLAENKFKVIICSRPSYFDVLSLIINDNAEIVAYATADKQCSGSFHHNYPILSLEQMDDVESDYILQFDELKTQILLIGSIGKKIVLNLTLFLQIYGALASPEFFVHLYDFQLAQKKFAGIVTGLSYSMHGIDIRALREKFGMLAGPGQDLYYDFQMLKYALSFPEVDETIRYALIGLSYYSFHYDLSKSINKHRASYYYPITGTMHNYEKQTMSMDAYNIFISHTNKILHPAYNQLLYKCMESFYKQSIDWSSKYSFNSLTKVQQENEICTMRQDFNKNYPATVVENKAILREYLTLLAERDIKPILFVCPSTIVYQECCPNDMKKEFMQIINDLLKEFDFQFLDYFTSPEFTYDDFMDASHLNLTGRTKLTELLNRDVLW